MLAEECILVDNDDNVIGHVSKKDSHLNENIRKGMLHRAFSVFLFNTKGELLLQQRSSKKITFPLVWTNTCCSHPLYVANEMEENKHLGVKRAAQRKLEHELGIKADTFSTDDFKFLTRLHYKAESDGAWGEHEIDHILFAQKDVEYKVNENEVEECKYVTKDQLSKLLQDSQVQWSPWFHMIALNFLSKYWDQLPQIIAQKGDCDDTTIHRLSLDQTQSS